MPTSTSGRSCPHRGASSVVSTNFLPMSSTPARRPLTWGTKLPGMIMCPDIVIWRTTTIHLSWLCCSRPTSPMLLRGRSSGMRPSAMPVYTPTTPPSCWRSAREASTAVYIMAHRWVLNSEYTLELARPMYYTPDRILSPSDEHLLLHSLNECSTVVLCAHTTTTRRQILQVV